MNAILRTERLTKAFGSLVVTNEVDLSVDVSERHAIIGPNGAGKTSLMHQIGGQLRPTSGRIFFKDKDVTGLPPETICRLGIARTFQRNNLFQSLTVIENVRLAVQAARGGSLNFYTPAAKLKTLVEFAERILSQVDLFSQASKPVHELSYGEQRQLEIAIALASEPDLLLLDEPTSGIAPAETARMIALIAGLSRRFAIVLIEHDMQVVFSLADRITVLSRGEILASGTPDQIRSDPQVREVYLGEDL